MVVTDEQINPTNLESVLVWDGDCSFCSRCVNFIEKRISTSAKIISHQKADLESLGLTTEQCNQALQWISSQGQIRSGSRAVAALLRSGGGAWGLVARGVPGPAPGGDGGPRGRSARAAGRGPPAFRHPGPAGRRAAGGGVCAAPHAVAPVAGGHLQ